MNTDILDIHGNRVKAQVGFDYHGYEISITTIGSKYVEILVWHDGEILDSFLSVEDAINCVNRLTTKMAMV